MAKDVLSGINLCPMTVGGSLSLGSSPGSGVCHCVLDFRVQDGGEQSCSDRKKEKTLNYFFLLWRLKYDEYLKGPETLEHCPESATSSSI